MKEIRYLLYEIVSVSMGLALLAFFGTLSFLPIEIMIMGEGQTVTWIFIILGISAILTFLLLSFVKRKNFYILLRILNVLTVLLTLVVINTYLIFTQDLFEPWLVQVGWFLRYHGLLVGLFVGVITFQTVTGISVLLSKFHDFKGERGQREEKGNERSSKLLTLLIIVCSSGFYSGEMLLFRYSSLFATLLSIFIIEISLIAFSIVLLSKTSYYDFIKIQINTENEISSGNHHNEEEPHKRDENEGSSAPKTRFISTINSKLKNAGTLPSRFWHLFIPLLPILILGIILAIIFPLNLLMPVAFPYGVGVLKWDIPITQVLSYLLVAILLIILTFYVYIGRMKRRLSKYYDKTFKSKLKITNYGILDGMRFLGIFLVISQILYFFEYVVYLPRVISFYLLFGCIGAIVFYFVGRTPNLRKIMYICAILILTLNFYLMYIDGITYAANPYSGEFDITFPFIYLHSWVNFVLVGIPVGIILSDLLLNVAFTHNDGGDSIKRALLITITPFMMGMLLTSGNYLNDNPGGNPPLMPQNYLIFFYFCLILGILLALGLGMNYLITEILVPRFIEKKSKIKVKKKNAIKSIGQKKIQKIIQGGSSNRRKIIAVSLMGIVVLSFVGSWGIYTTYSQTYQRPIIGFSPGNYYIWIQNASERVSRDVLISETSPRIDAVELTMAKNEYMAVQFVWRPFKVIQGLSYEISNFHHQNNSDVINATQCSLRYVDHVIEDEFPDLLRPFSEMTLDKRQNYAFWFVTRSPYDAIEGTYTGNLTFNFNTNEEAILPIHLNIWNFTIPQTRHLRTSIGGRSDNYTRINNYLDHRLNDYGVEIYYTDNLTLLNTVEKYTCYLNTITNNWTFNWTWWDNIIQYKLDHGMNAFTVNYPLGIADGRDPYLEDAPRMLRLKNWLSDVEAHLENKSWLNYSYLYFIDEFNVFIPSGYSRVEYFNRCRILLSEIKNASPNIKIMTTTPPSQELEDLREYFDIFCPITNDRDKERWEERLADDCEFWTYTCIGPLAPWPNVQLYNRLWETRVLMWQVWLYDIHGFLYWHSQRYYHGDYGFAYNGYGDGWFLYEMEGQLYDSIRWENFLEAQEDFEYLWLLNATLAYLEDHPGLIPPNEIADFQTELDTIVTSIAGERWVYCDHPSAIYNGRDRIGTILHELSNIVNTTAIGEAAWFPPFRPG